MNNLEKEEDIGFIPKHSKSIIKNDARTTRRLNVLNRINVNSMNELQAHYDIVDPDFDDENFLTSFNYSMDVNEPYRGNLGSCGQGNRLPSGKDNEYVTAERRRIESLRNPKRKEKSKLYMNALLSGYI